MKRRVGLLLIAGFVVFIVASALSSWFIAIKTPGFLKSRFPQLTLVVLGILSLTLASVFYWLFETFIYEKTIKKKWVVFYATPIEIIWFGLFGLLYPLGGILSLVVIIAIISVFNGGISFTR